MDNIGRTPLRPGNQRTSRLNYSWLPWRPAQLHYIRLFISRAVFYKKLETKIWPIFPIEGRHYHKLSRGVIPAQMCLSADLPRHGNNVVGIKMRFHPRQELLVLILMTAALWQLGFVWHCSHFPLIRHLTQSPSRLSSPPEYLNEVDTSGKENCTLGYIYFWHICTNPAATRVTFGR